MDMVSLICNMHWLHRSLMLSDVSIELLSSVFVTDFT